MSAPHDHASEAHAHMADHDESELVSRSVQAGLGLFVAVLVYSAAFGGLFGLAFAFAYGPNLGHIHAAGTFRGDSGRWFRLCLSGAQFEISSKSAGRWRTSDHRHSHRALFCHDCNFACRDDCVAGDLSGLLVTRFSVWNSNLFVAACYIALIRIATGPPRSQRGACAVSGSLAVELPRRIDRSTPLHVGDASACFSALSRRPSTPAVMVGNRSADLDADRRTAR